MGDGERSGRGGRKGRGGKGGGGERGKAVEGSGLRIVGGGAESDERWSCWLVDGAD